MSRVIRWTEEFQHFVNEVKQSFWGEFYGQRRQVWKEKLEAE